MNVEARHSETNVVATIRRPRFRASLHQRTPRPLREARQHGPTRGSSPRPQRKNAVPVKNNRRHCCYRELETDKQSDWHSTSMAPTLSGARLTTPEVAYAPLHKKNPCIRRFSRKYPRVQFAADVQRINNHPQDNIGVGVCPRVHFRQRGWARKNQPNRVYKRCSGDGRNHRSRVEKTTEDIRSNAAVRA